MTVIYASAYLLAIGTYSPQLIALIIFGYGMARLSWRRLYLEDKSCIRCKKVDLRLSLWEFHNYQQIPNYRNRRKPSHQPFKKT